MALTFNRFLDRWKHRILSYAGDVELRDYLIRSDVSFADFTLTSTQLDSANATPVTILAAPGSGLINVVSHIVTYVDAGATPFELGSGTLGYLDEAGTAVATAVPNTTVESATDTYYVSVALACVPAVNSAIQAKPSADVTAGNGTIYGRIYYRTVNVSEFA